MKTFWSVLLVAVLVSAQPSRAMCGGIFRKKGPTKQQATVIADAALARIINKTSKVLLARDGEDTTIVMANDVLGDFEEFALVVPVPTVITANQVSVIDPFVFTQLEQATSPSLTEVFDPDPCPSKPSEPEEVVERTERKKSQSVVRPAPPRASDFEVKVEAHYAVGEYDIAVLTGKDSTKLVEWLNLFDYGIPDEAAPMFESYIGQGMRFFVARVKLAVQRKTGAQYLRPLRVQYRTPKFMLPIRLGMLNADGPQELVVYGFSKLGRIETVNYRTQVLEGGAELPAFVKADFSNFYTAYFDEQTRKQSFAAVFSEFSGQLDAWSVPGLVQPRPPPPQYAPPRVSIDKVQVRGGPQPEAVRASIEARLAAIDGCASRASPGWGGRLPIGFSISERGRVTSMHTSMELQPLLEECVAAQLKGWTFPPARSGKADATVVFLFAAQPPVLPPPGSPGVLGVEWAGSRPIVSRLHLKYDREHVPEDLVLQETGDQAPRRVRFSVRHPWLGDANKCPEARTYLATLPARFEAEAVTMASLTGLDVNALRARQPKLPPLPPPVDDRPWWKRLLGN